MFTSSFNENGFINHPTAIRDGSIKVILQAEATEIEMLLAAKGIKSCTPFLEGCLLYSKHASYTFAEMAYISGKFNEARAISIAA